MEVAYEISHENLEEGMEEYTNCGKHHTDMQTKDIGEQTNIRRENTT